MRTAASSSVIGFTAYLVVRTKIADAEACASAARASPPALAIAAPSAPASTARVRRGAGMLARPLTTPLPPGAPRLRVTHLSLTLRACCITFSAAADTDWVHVVPAP